MHSLRVLKSKSPVFNSTITRGMQCDGSVTLENMNQGIRKMAAPLLGNLYERAEQLKKEIGEGKKKPFPFVITAHMDDPQAKFQKPITFFRQVMACIMYPELIKISKLPEDVKKRANEILDSFAARSVGSYTPSNGSDYIRKTICNFLKERDGYLANPDDIVVTSGATDAIHKVMNLFGQRKSSVPSGIMIPKPCYPIYPSVIISNNMHEIGYYLDERHKWSINVLDLKNALEEHRRKCHPRCLIVINPNNPTGSLLTEENIRDIVQFAYDEKVLIIADEVYQNCIYDTKVKFHSFKKVMMSMGEPYNRRELVSINSLSKGFVGEAGMRGGYMEVLNFWPAVRATFYKMITASLCPPATSQSIVAMSCKPPKRGDPSYDRFEKEKNDIQSSLNARAKLVEEVFNSLSRASCSTIQGSMFAFPRIDIPQKAIDEAELRKMTPCEMYCTDLLEQQGVCILPGSNFGQRPGTFHVRTTLMPAVELFEEMMTRIKKFHTDFMNKYA